MSVTTTLTPERQRGDWRASQEPNTSAERPSMTAMTRPWSPSVRMVEKLPRPLRMAFSSTNSTRQGRRRRALANNLPWANTRAITLCQRSP